MCRDLKDTRPEVPGAPRLVQLACVVISMLAKAEGAGFCVPAAAIIPELLPFLSRPREVRLLVRKEGLEAALTSFIFLEYFGVSLQHAEGKSVGQVARFKFSSGCGLFVVFLLYGNTWYYFLCALDSIWLPSILLCPLVNFHFFCIHVVPSDYFVHVRRPYLLQLLTVSNGCHLSRLNLFYR